MKSQLQSSIWIKIRAFTHRIQQVCKWPIFNRDCQFANRSNLWQITRILIPKRVLQLVLNLESFVLDVMEGKKAGRPFLKIFSYLYQGGVALRNFGYDAHLIKKTKVGIPVVSIGNIVAGGTGKTPLVRLLADTLSSKIKVAILSRGYRSQMEKSGLIARVSPCDNAEKCGDESFWLSQVVSQASVWVGKNRSLSAYFAKKAGAELLILDDGMQYRKLERDFEIAVMDGDDLFGKGHFLPRGLLRDTPKRLEKTDLVVINGAKDREDARQRVAQYTKAPLIFMQMCAHRDLKGKKIGIFCAIGKPQRFIQTVRECGGEVVATFFKADHGTFYPEELDAFAKRSCAELLVCTEKDHIKLAKNFQCSLPLIALEGNLEIIEGREHWDTLVKTIKERVIYE